MIKSNRKFIKNKEKAVSVVIGVILMVAITVAVATTIFVYMSGMGGETSRPSTLLMNTYSHNDGTDTRIWLVIGAAGEALPDNSYAWTLLNSTGANATDTGCYHNPITEPGYISTGDTFVVTAPEDGYYVFMLSNTATGQTIFKSSSVKY